MNNVRGRPFAPGNKQGRGRPKGSRNKEKAPGQHLLEEYAPHLMRKCIALAMQGDRSAMRICLERVIPRRGAFVRMNLPAIRTAADVDKAAEKVTQAIRRGEITPTEGGSMMNLLESRSRIIERVQTEEEKQDMNAVANANQHRDLQLEALSDEELAQLIALTQKMDAAVDDGSRVDLTATG